MTDSDPCIKSSEAIVGTCNALCPQQEIEMREREGLVHLLEVWEDDRHTLVKSYRRSAADTNMAEPSLLRHYVALQNTLTYLLHSVSKRTDVSEACKYDFINDRLRAVRQDMTIQRLSDDECANLLEPMIRFYVYYGYELCELTDNKDFDPVLNKKYLMECIMWFLTCMKEDYTRELGIDTSCDFILVECLYLLCNLDSLIPINRYYTLPPGVTDEIQLKLAYDIAISNNEGNYVRVCQLIRKRCVFGSCELGPLLFCAVCPYLPTLQRRALEVMSHAYNSKNLTVPVTVIRRWLLFNSDSEVIAACEHYGLKTIDGAVLFNKADFKHDVATLKPVKQKELEKDYVFSVKEIYGYNYRASRVTIQDLLFNLYI